jgi:hypothetical protein
MNFKPYGGYELFLKEDESSYKMFGKLPFINEILRSRH